MTGTGTGIAGAMSYQPRETGDAPNECATCGKDFGEGASKVAAAIPGTGLVQYCSKACAPPRSPAEERLWMVARIRALEDALRRALALIEAIQTNDPNEPISDDGHTCRDAWEYEAESLRADLTNTDKGES